MNTGVIIGKRLPKGRLFEIRKKVLGPGYSNAEKQMRIGRRKEEDGGDVVLSQL